MLVTSRVILDAVQPRQRAVCGRTFCSLPRPINHRGFAASTLLSSPKDPCKAEGNGGCENPARNHEAINHVREQVVREPVLPVMKVDHGQQ